MRTVSNAENQAERFSRLYAEIFALFCRQIPKRTDLTPESLAVLSHFEMTGPLTVTEAARHLSRAQSVVSEIVSRLETKGMVCRLADRRDRRRTLVWLTPKGQGRLREQREVLSVDRLRAVFERVNPESVQALLDSLLVVVREALANPPQPKVTQGDRR
jgi:DNA-binding MarR family transcriptional regulator